MKCEGMECTGGNEQNHFELKPSAGVPWHSWLRGGCNIQVRHTIIPNWHRASILYCDGMEKEGMKYSTSH